LDEFGGQIITPIIHQEEIMRRSLIIAVACFFSVLSFAYSEEAYIVVDGKGAILDNVITDLLLDKAVYNGHRVSLTNIVYPRFGVKSKKVGFYKAAPWFSEAETYLFSRTDLLHDKGFDFYYQPLMSDRDTRKEMLNLDGKNFATPLKMTINGKFIEHRLTTGLVLYLFLVESFEVNGKKYVGLIPEAITK
jgi:hypothetical protein